MTKTDFYKRVAATKLETHTALATVWAELNHGQHMKLLKNEQVAEVLRRYGVIDE